MRHSFYLAILEALRRNKGKLIESNLVDALRSKGFSFTTSDLHKALLKLEFTGKIRVFSLDEERKIIELIEQG